MQNSAVLVAVKEGGKGSLAGWRTLDWSGPICGLCFVAISYGVIVPLAGRSYLWAVFFQSGWIGVAIMFFAGWPSWLLYARHLLTKGREELLREELLPGEFGKLILKQDALLLARRLQATLGDRIEEPLPRRLYRALSHFGVRGDVSETVDLLEKQASADAQELDTSYTMVRTFIWALPILGFIGTVMGIGASIGAFSTQLRSAEDLVAVKSALGVVIEGLALAFNTTLLGLVTSLVLVFASNALFKAEQAYLARIREYCTEHLELRLKGDPSQTES